MHTLAELLGVSQEKWLWDDQDIRTALARLAAKVGPDYVLGERPLGESRPKGTDEVRPQGDNPSEDSPFHGGDGNSGECDHPAATVSGETGLAAAIGEQDSPGGGSPTGNPSRPETDGNTVTSGDDVAGGSPPSPAHGVVDPSSTALGGNNMPDGNSDFDSAEPLRDADGAESQAPLDVQDGEAESAEPNNLGEDGPALRKKWGKLKAAHRNPAGRDQHGGIHADLAKIGVDPLLLRLARKRLADLVGDAAQDSGPRYNWPEFCVRLRTHRDPRRARREEVGRPVLWVLADVSGSCSPFAWPALQVAKACGRLGVPGADVVVISHSNGYPAGVEVNGRPYTTTLPDRYHEILPWFQAVARRYPPEVVVALGDWDAAGVYGELARLPEVQRLLWLDNYGCSRGPLDQTAWARERLRQRGVPKAALQKVRYVDGCRGAVEFINQIK